MTAKESFEKIGFVQMPYDDDDEAITYICADADKQLLRIVFNLKFKSWKAELFYWFLHTAPTSSNMALPITPCTMRAIVKQIKELGWDEVLAEEDEQ